MDEQNYKQSLEGLYSGLTSKLQIYRKRKRRCARDYKQRLEGLYSGLIPKLQIYRQEKQRWDRFLSTDFNVVSEFIDPDENRLSDIIACLLDANGSHGQGSKFLASFLKRLFMENQTNPVAELSRDQIQVKREDPTYYNDENQHRRIDITIDFKDDFKDVGIGIENKPWPESKEQPNQLRAYYKHLKGKYKKCFLVYITPDSTHPTTIDNPEDLIQNGELYCLSYSSDILEWIEECWQLCESDRFRWFLRDFKEYVRNAFPPSLTIKEDDDANE